jgi:hypothetical protein
MAVGVFKASKRFLFNYFFTVGAFTQIYYEKVDMKKSKDEVSVSVYDTIYRMIKFKMTYKL